MRILHGLMLSLMITSLLLPLLVAAGTDCSDHPDWCGDGYCDDFCNPFCGFLDGCDCDAECKSDYKCKTVEGGKKCVPSCADRPAWCGDGTCDPGKYCYGNYKMCDNGQSCDCDAECKSGHCCNGVCKRSCETTSSTTSTTSTSTTSSTTTSTTTSTKTCYDYTSCSACVNAGCEWCDADSTCHPSGFCQYECSDAAACYTSCPTTTTSTTSSTTTSTSTTTVSCRCEYNPIIGDMVCSSDCPNAGMPCTSVDDCLATSTTSTTSTSTTSSTTTTQVNCRSYTTCGDCVEAGCKWCDKDGECYSATECSSLCSGACSSSCVGACGGSFEGVKCGQCERLKISGGRFYCEPDDSCHCTREGCDSGWTCREGICQQSDVTKQCRAIIGGDCNDYYDILGVCQQNEPNTKWTAQVDFLCSAFLRKGWCYNRPECNDVCGNDKGMPCGAYGKKAYRGQRCTFNTNTLRCEVVSDSNCNYPSPVTFEWKNVQDSSAEVYIKVTADYDYAGSIKFAIRKNVAWSRDPYCDLDGNCGSDEIYHTAFSGVQKGTHEYTKTFKAKEEGDYHFDVYYESYHYGKTKDIHLSGSSTGGECGVQCGSGRCGECETCVFYPDEGPTCEPDDSCSCSSCEGGSCVCRGGICVKSCSAECKDAGYLYVGCKCRPREKGLVYLELDPNPCVQNCPLWHNPRECACRVDERCGAVCGTTRTGELNYCKPDERCEFVQTGSSGNDYSGFGRCVYDTSCNVCSAQNCGETATNDAGKKFYCIYYNGNWMWSEAEPEYFCCNDDDCKVYGSDWICDTTTYRCVNPNLGCCQYGNSCWMTTQENCYYDWYGPDYVCVNGECVKPKETQCFDGINNDADEEGADYCDSDCLNEFNCPKYYFKIYSPGSLDCDAECKNKGFARGEEYNCPGNRKACVCFTECCSEGSIEECGYETCEAEGYPNRYKECREVPEKSTSKYTIYRCLCGPCVNNEDCTPGTCCTREGPATTGNPGPGKPRDEAQCKKLENPWLCDPPSKNFFNLLNLQPESFYQ